MQRAKMAIRKCRAARPLECIVIDGAPDAITVAFAHSSRPRVDTSGPPDRVPRAAQYFGLAHPASFTQSVVSPSSPVTPPETMNVMTLAGSASSGLTWSLGTTTTFPPML
jgi:hypothetical protein